MASNLPTLSKTWQYNANNTAAYQGSLSGTYLLVLQSFVAAMKGVASSPWTVGYSCNGVTVGTVNDGVDRFSSGSLTTSTSVFSWIVLKQPGLVSTAQLLIFTGGWNGFSGFNNIGFTYSPVSGFTGGSTTAVPTATDGMNFGPNNNSPFSNFNGQLRWSYMQSTDGQCNRIIVAGNSTVLGAVFIEKLAGITTGFNNNGVVSQGNLLSNATNAVSRQGTSFSTFQGAYETNSLIALASEIDGNYPMLPLGCVGTTVSARGKWGMFQDLWIGSSAVNIGDTYPGTSETPANQFVQLNNQIIVPWNQGSFSLV